MVGKSVSAKNNLYNLNKIIYGLNLFVDNCFANGSQIYTFEIICLGQLELINLRIYF